MSVNRGDLSGRTLGNCTLERLLGQGGMGAVYLARQERPSRWVAVKVLQPVNVAITNHGNEEFLARFRREADVIARLEHVNIMPIYEYGEQDGLAYLVMPYVSGGSLKDVLVKRGALTLPEAMTYIDQAASALDYAHSQGVVHRDLKPANFLLHADGRLVLADFGIARIIEESVSTGATLTSAGTILGTPEYMAPEMASGGVIDYRADIYELGVVLFQMLTGKLPFSGTTPYAVVIKQMQEALPSIRQSNPAFPASVDVVIQKATAKQPDNRYQAARAMAQALHQASSAPTSNFGNPVMDAPPALPSTSRPLILPATSNPEVSQHGLGSYNQGAISQGTSGANWANQNAASNYPNSYPAIPGYQGYPTQQAGQYVPPIEKKKQPWGMVAGIIVLLALVISGVVFGTILLNKNKQQGNTGVSTSPTIPSSQATVTPTPAPTPTPSPTAGPTATPTPAIPPTLIVGSKLYGTNRPGPNCDQGGGQWATYNGAHVTCLPARSRLTNPDQNQGVAGVLLSGFGGGSFPVNYVVQAHIQQQGNANGGFGLYFRNQPGAQNQGVYTFMVQPDGTWAIISYDNNNGTPTTLKTGALNVDPHGTLELAVIANGSRLSAYIDGNLVGSVVDSTYSSGTVGLAVGPGVTITVTNFVLANLATS